MHLITSREHKVVKQLARLQQSTQFRKKMNATILDGIHLVQAYLSTDQVPENIVVSESGLKNKEIEILVNTVEQRKKTPLILVSDPVFKKISPVQTPTGILAMITIPETDFDLQKSSVKSDCCVLLEAVQDPGNLGTILRSAAAANVAAIFLSVDCADVWSPKTLRAAMGAHFLLKIYRNCNLTEIAHRFQGQVIGTEPAAYQNLYQLDLTRPTAFVLGNEGAGLSEAMLKATDITVSIPMPGKIESLNAAAAATICLFEKVRQDSQQKIEQAH